METNESLEKKREQANKLVQEIQFIKSESQSHYNSIKKINEQINIKDKEFKKNIETVDKFSAISKDAIETLKVEKIKIQTLLNQVNLFYDKKYLPLVEKIENKENGFNARIAKGNKLNKELDKITIECSKQYDEIKNYVHEYQKKSKEFNVIGGKIIKLFESSEKNKLNSDSLLTSIKNANKEIEKLLSQTRIDKKESNDLVSEIESIKKDSHVLFADISEKHIHAKEKLEAIQEIYEIAHETGLSGEFENRRNKHKEEISKWESRIFFSSLVLLIGLIVLFICQLWLYKWDLTNKTFDVNFYIRFLILSPIIFYLTFCSTQYNKAKKLYDKYSFKTTLAMSIKSHIELLTQNEKFQEKESMDKLLDFIINAFNKIYQEPYDDDYKMKIKLSNIELDLQKKFFEKIDDIKNNVS